jgi:hypothetical protein
MQTHHVAPLGGLDLLLHVYQHQHYAKIEANTYFGMNIIHQTKLMS